MTGTGAAVAASHADGPVAAGRLPAMVRAVNLRSVLFAERAAVAGQGGLVHLHHRRPVRAGGSRDPEIHARPAWARAAGLLLTAGADPEAVPVRVQGRGLIRLSNDGGLNPACEGRPAWQ